MGDPPAKSAVKCRMISPQFVLPDVVASAEYYRDVLGFRILGYFLNPPVHAIVARDSSKFILGNRATAAPLHPTPAGPREALTPTFG